jgi:hypothetical protein
MDEVELLFKHALVQQAVYDSIFLQKRKKLHLDVAVVIKLIFQDRLREVSGVLAYHYIQAEDLDKAEQYLLAAGEVSLALSASTEAVHYFQEGLRLYLAKSESKADPARVARLEEKIGLSLANQGLVFAAASHFETALTFLGRRSPRGLRQVLQVSAGVAMVARLLVFPQWRGRRVPDERQKGILRNELNLASCYYSSDAVKEFAGFLCSARDMLRYRSDALPSMAWAWSYISAALCMAWAIRPAKRLLNSQVPQCEALPDEDRGSITGTHLYIELILGSWDSELFNAHCDTRSVEKATLFSDLSAVYCGLKAIEWADFDEVRRRIEQLKFVADELQRPSSIACHFELQSKHLLKSGRAEELLALHRSFDDVWVAGWSARSTCPNAGRFSEGPGSPRRTSARGTPWPALPMRWRCWRTRWRGGITARRRVGRGWPPTPGALPCRCPGSGSATGPRPCVSRAPAGC